VGNVPHTRLDIKVLAEGTERTYNETGGETAFVPYVYVHPYISSFARVPADLRLFSDDIAERPCYVAMVQSHCIKYRMRLFELLQQRLGKDKVEARGVCGNTEQSQQHRVRKESVFHVARDCRMLLALENGNSRPGYITEKIMNAFLAGTVPIYSGDAPSSIARRLFNPDAFVDVQQFYNETNRHREWGDYIDVTEVCTVAAPRCCLGATDDTPRSVCEWRVVHALGQVDEEALAKAADYIAELVVDSERLRRMRTAPISHDMADLNLKLRYMHNGGAGFPEQLEWTSRIVKRIWPPTLWQQQ
jgi:hypothetical protein